MVVHKDTGQQLVDDALRLSIRSTALIVGTAYFAIGLIHAFTLPEPAASRVGGFELLCGLGLLTLGAFTPRRIDAEHEAHLRAATPALAVIACNFVYLLFAREPQSTFGLYIVAVGIGLIAYPRSWFVGLMSLTVGVWLWLAVTSGATVGEWSEHGVVMGAMVALGCAVHAWRQGYIARIALLKQSARVEVERREKADERLARVEQSFRRLADHARDIIIEFDHKGLIDYANPVIEDILGHPPESLFGHNGRGIVVDNDSDVLGRKFRERQEGSLPPRWIVQVQHRDGSDRWLEVGAQGYPTAGAKVGEDGQATPVRGRFRTVVIARDVTTRIEAEKELARHRDRLEELVKERTEALTTSMREVQHRERLASLGTLTAGIAHQINNPMGAILTSAEFALALEGDEDEREVWRRALDDNAQQARRCGEIVRSMLRFARNEVTDKRRESLTQIVREVCHELRPSIEEMRGDLNVELSVEDVPIRASAIEFQQVMLNLLQNAVQAAKGAPQVDVEIDCDKKSARVRVRDRGPGIEIEVLTRVFDPFFSTRLATGGSGLGLSVAREIVQDHGGTLDIASTVGEGTTATIEIPLDAQDED